MFGAKQSSMPQWNNNKTTEQNDWYCENGPEDSINNIRFSNVSNWENDPQFISCSSWDGFVKVWEIKLTGSAYSPSAASQFQGEFNFDAPVLGHCWMPDNSLIFGACADNQLKVWDLNSNTSQKIGEHSHCVKDVFYDSQHNIVISSGWDGHIKFWDMKQSGPVLDISKSYILEYAYFCECISESLLKIRFMLNYLVKVII